MGVLLSEMCGGSRVYRGAGHLASYRAVLQSVHMERITTITAVRLCTTGTTKRMVISMPITPTLPSTLPPTLITSLATMPMVAAWITL
ncbi:MAG: hypothetical protein ACLP9L_21115 [Thermoguttaceae bacterium]